MLKVNNYDIVYKNNFYHIISDDPRTCPSCNGLLKYRDYRKRKVIMIDGSVSVYKLRRFKCSNCGKLHTEIPNIILPNKHYNKEVIKSAIYTSSTMCPAENSTIFRWKSSTLKID